MRATAGRSRRRWRGSDGSTRSSPVPASSTFHRSEFPEESWEAMLAVMLTSPFLLARYAWRRSAPLPRGGSSLSPRFSGSTGAPTRPPTSRPSTASSGSSRRWRSRAATRHSRQRDLPGVRAHPLVEGQVAGLAREHGIPEDRVVEELILTLPVVKRLLEPSEIAGMVSFLLGPGRTRVHRLGDHDGPRPDRELRPRLRGLG